MAAIKRNIIHEACVALEISGARTLWDFKKLFDTMDVGILAMAALRYGYPPAPSFITLLIHTATRVISADGVVSADMLPANASIVAGCIHSASWTRCFLYDLLGTLHRAYMPYTNLDSWVD